MTEARTPSGLPVLIRVWLALTATLPLVLTLAARVMHRRQSAPPERLRERLGHSSLARPGDRLIWVHAASVGEVTSVARLARQLLDRGDVALLVTTTTATGAATAARLLPGALHQFLAVDTPAVTRRFLDHWRPDAALFVEGDFWPRMILLLAARDCPMILLNARASGSRARFPVVSAVLLARMRLITVQDADIIADLRALGLDPTTLSAPGNLKADIDTPTVDEALRNTLIAAAQGRGGWAAVSTHPGEETLLLDVQSGLAAKPLLILVPRHPMRGRYLAAELVRRGFLFTQFSKGETPETGTDVHLMDALGVTGTVYSAAGLAFVGGSLVDGHGGHTPFEPIALGCAVLSGPFVQNFASAYASLQAVGAACLVPDAAALRARIEDLLAGHATRKTMQIAAVDAFAAQRGATERTLEALRAALPDLLGPPTREPCHEAGFPLGESDAHEG